MFEFDLFEDLLECFFADGGGLGEFGVGGGFGLEFTAEAEVGVEAAAEAVGADEEAFEGGEFGVDGGVLHAAQFGGGVGSAKGFGLEVGEDVVLGHLIAPDVELVADHVFDDVEFFLIGGFVLEDGFVMHDLEGGDFGVIDGGVVDEPVACGGAARGLGFFEVGEGGGVAFGGLGAGGELGVEAVGPELETGDFSFAHGVRVTPFGYEGSWGFWGWKAVGRVSG